MASSSETGHAKNVANFKSLNETNAGFGVTYNPSNALLKNGTMVTQYTDCDTKQKAVNTQRGIFDPIDNARRIEFSTVKKLVRRVRSAAKTSGASSDFVKNVNTKVTKILGERMTTATPKVVVPPAPPADPAGTSASQQSFDNTQDNFDALVGILAAETLYKPNEADLKVTSLQTKLAAMKSKNDAVKVGVVPLNNAVVARNVALYTTATGLVDVAQKSKEYDKSIFGFSSPNYKLVSKLKFVKLAKVD